MGNRKRLCQRDGAGVQKGGAEIRRILLSVGPQQRGVCDAGVREDVPCAGRGAERRTLRLTDEDAECLRRFSEIRKKFFSKPVAFRLAFSADGEKWEEDGVEYHLDNIAANPIPQMEMELFRVHAMRDDVRRMGLGEGRVRRAKLGWTWQKVNMIDRIFGVFPRVPLSQNPVNPVNPVEKHSAQTIFPAWRSFLTAMSGRRRLTQTP